MRGGEYRFPALAHDRCGLTAASTSNIRAHHRHDKKSMRMLYLPEARGSSLVLVVVLGLVVPCGPVRTD